MKKVKEVILFYEQPGVIKPLKQVLEYKLIKFELVLELEYKLIKSVLEHLCIYIKLGNHNRLNCHIILNFNDQSIL